jgi:hypothetical protein
MRVLVCGGRDYRDANGITHFWAKDWVSPYR